MNKKNIIIRYFIVVMRKLCASAIFVLSVKYLPSSNSPRRIIFVVALFVCILNSYVILNNARPGVYSLFLLKDISKYNDDSS